MDAPQKRKIWKVATIHFAISLIFLVNPPLAHVSSFYQKVTPRLCMYEFYLSSCEFFQPQCLLFESIPNDMRFNETVAFNRSLAHFFGFKDWWRWRISSKVAIPIYLALMPLWSLCFSWVYVRCVNWLNRFPILGFPIQPVKWSENLVNWSTHHPVLGKRVF
jgi:hypothetical protein